MQLVLLVDALLLNAIPALLLSDPQGTRDVVSKVQSLLLGQIVSCRQKRSRHECNTASEMPSTGYS